MPGESGRIYRTLHRAGGPIIVVERVTDVAYGERVEVLCGDGTRRRGTVLDVSVERAVVQVFEGTEGLSLRGTSVKFLGRSVEFTVSPALLGRVLSGTGSPLDGMPLPFEGATRSVYGSAINPVTRDYPTDVIETGVSLIDGMNTLVRGQKLPIFSGNGLPHNELAAQIARQAAIRGADEPFAVVFAAMGVKNDDAAFFREELERTGALENATMFLNLASDPPEERLLTPRFALTLAEHLAFEHDFHVLVILTDMTNYCEALREMTSARGEVPSRKGYPGYLYSDLADLYERCGRVKTAKGSITQLPILTMPSDDITHPIPDLTGYITEGQIVLDRELHQKGVYPPINPLPSLSRIMKDAIGAGRTREDHPNVANQLYSVYARVGNIRSLAAIVGAEELTDTDQRHLRFGDAFEEAFIGQRRDERRTIEQTLEIAWDLLGVLPRDALHRVTPEELAKYHAVRDGVDEQAGD
ncbi:MAG: V-type ATP synthase subunit B [Kiritimatiellae bacterium]|nr:V-type ATP synthase subunit B [Kiritimatiellia bacterium]